MTSSGPRIHIDPGLGRAVLGGVEVAVAAVGGRGEVRVGGEDGPLLRPLLFGERSRVAAAALGSAVPESSLAAAVLEQATVEAGPGDRAVLEAIALALAGAAVEAPGFRECVALLAGDADLPPEELDGLEAAAVDRLASELAGGSEPDGWRRLVLAPPQVEDVEELVRELAAVLLRRAVSGDTRWAVDRPMTPANQRWAARAAEPRPASTRQTAPWGPPPADDPRAAAGDGPSDGPPGGGAEELAGAGIPGAAPRRPGALAGGLQPPAAKAVTAPDTPLRIRPAAAAGPGPAPEAPGMPVRDPAAPSPGAATSTPAAPPAARLSLVDQDPTPLAPAATAIAAPRTASGAPRGWSTAARHPARRSASVVTDRARAATLAPAGTAAGSPPAPNAERASLRPGIRVAAAAPAAGVEVPTATGSAAARSMSSATAARPASPVTPRAGVQRPAADRRREPAAAALPAIQPPPVGSPAPLTAGPDPLTAAGGRAALPVGLHADPAELADRLALLLADEADLRGIDP